MFKINLKDVKLEEGIDFEKLVKLTEGYSGADISNLCRDAAFMNIRKKNLAKFLHNKGNITDIESTFLSDSFTLSNHFKAKQAS